MAPLEYLSTSGTDNAMWRVRLEDEPDVVVRLPRRPGAAAGVAQEMRVLRGIENARLRSIVATPSVRHFGQPSEVFPHCWCVLQWLPGIDAWTGRADLTAQDLDAFAHDLATATMAIREIAGVVVERRSPGDRGGPLGPLLARLDRWLDDPQLNASALIEVDSVRRLVAEARELVDEPVAEGFVHGDLIPGNLLIERQRLAAIIDWGGAGWGDVAQDLAPAWAIYDAPQRDIFRQATGADPAAWLRGRTFELEHAVGGVLYYRPLRHPLGDVMARTLARIVEEG